MAKVVSLFKLSGTISDLTFRQTKDGPVAQMKPGPSREKVLHGPTFRRTRLNASEFKLAVKEATQLRHALANAMNGMQVGSLNGRMNGLFYQAATGDPENRLGSRYASNGNIQLLTGFDFNKHLPLAYALPVKFGHQLDVATGVLKVALPAFIARKKKGFPVEATHFCIVSGGVAIDFDRGRDRNDVKLSELMPLRRKTPGPICFEHALEAGEDDVLVQVLGIRFYKVVNGKAVLLQGGAMQILEAVRVEETRIENENELHELAFEQVAAEGIAEGLQELVEVENEGSEGSVLQHGVRRRGCRGRAGMPVLPGRKRLLFCRSSVDLHYICNPSEGKYWLPVGQADAGTPGTDP